MARGLTTAFKNALATKNIKPCYLVFIDFPTPVYFTTTGFDLSYDGNNYSKQGFLLSISNVTESTDITQNTLRLVLSGVDQTYISIVLNNVITHKQVKIHLGLLDTDNSLIADPYILFDGRIKSFSIEEKEGDSIISLQVSSLWADFERINGRRTTENSQQKLFSADRGFQYSGVTVKDIKWGRT
jgi:hypothetical protein